LTFEAFNANIGANPYHFPFVAAARMGLAQPNYITKLYIHRHHEVVWQPFLSF
jgi:hypothetical protein